MEIKDVNSLVNQILSGKTDLKSIAFESAFAEMVKEKSEEKQSTEVVARDVSANSKSAKKSAEAKVASKAEVYRASKKEVDASSNERKVDVKTSTSEKSVSENKSTEAKTPEKTSEKNNSEKAEDRSEAVETDEASGAAGVEVKAEKEDSTDSVEVEETVPFVATILTEVAPESADGEDVEVSSVGAIDEEDSVLLNGDDEKGLDVEKPTSETKNASSQVVSEPVVEAEEVAKVVDSFKKTQNADVETVDDQTSLSKTDSKKASKSESAVEVSALADEKLVAQAEKISEIVGSDKKMKVSVEVKEEKIAYSTGKLVNNAVEVAEAVDEAASKGSLVSDSEANSIVNQNVSASRTTQANPAVVVPNQAVATQVVATPNVSVEGAAAENLKAADLSVSGVSQAQASAKTVLNSELVAKDESKAAVKDVYKGMSKEAVEQVKVNITKSAIKGIDKINIQLKPEELGTIEVKMQIGKDGKISAHIVSNKPETLEILQKDVQSLENAFNEAGFQTDGQSLSFSYRQQQEENRAQLKSFIGDVLGKEAEVANQDYSWNANGGLNIRV